MPFERLVLFHFQANAARLGAGGKSGNGAGGAGGASRAGGRFAGVNCGDPEVAEC